MLATPGSVLEKALISVEEYGNHLMIFLRCVHDILLDPCCGESTARMHRAAGSRKTAMAVAATYVLHRLWDARQ